MPKNHVVFHHEAFARGSFGSAHRGVWGPGTEVIVKCLTMDESAIGTKSHSKVLSEINIWHQLNHPNVIKMFGASHVSSPPFIVCEEAPYGNLFEFLAKSEQNGRWMWRLLYQAALGLQYIHGMKVVHGDLKLNNILVGVEHTAKLADFGLSAIRMSSALTRATASGATPESGDLRWRAPECLKNRPTFASDVYSLAMCIIEAVSGETPFGFLSDDDVRFNLSRGEIPDKPEGIFDQAWTLVIGMTNADTCQRTPLTDVIIQMKVFADAEDIVCVEEDTEVCSECYMTVPSAATFCSSCGFRLKSGGEAAVRHSSCSDSLFDEKDEDGNADVSVDIDEVSTYSSEYDATNLGSRATQQPSVTPVQPSHRVEEQGCCESLTPTRDEILSIFAVLINGNEQQQITAARALAKLSEDDNVSSIIDTAAGNAFAKMLTSDGKNEMKAMADLAHHSGAHNYAQPDPVSVVSKQDKQPQPEG